MTRAVAGTDGRAVMTPSGGLPRPLTADPR